MGILGRLFGGSSAGSGPTMASAAGEVLPASLGEKGGGEEWRALGPMPVTMARFSPMVQTSRFESSLTTRSRPTSLAPLVHDRSAQYLSGIVDGIAVAFPASPGGSPATRPAPSSQPEPDAPRVGVVQRFARRWNGFFGAGADDPPAGPLPDATAGPITGSVAQGPNDEADGLSGARSPIDVRQFDAVPPVEMAATSSRDEAATMDNPSPSVTHTYPSIAQRLPVVAGQSGVQSPTPSSGTAAPEPDPSPPFRPVIDEAPPGPLPPARATESSEPPTMVLYAAGPGPQGQGDVQETADRTETATSLASPLTGSTSGMATNEGPTTEQSSGDALSGPMTISRMAERPPGEASLRTHVQRETLGLTPAIPAQSPPSPPGSTARDGAPFRLRIGAPVNSVPETNSEGIGAPLPLTAPGDTPGREITPAISTPSISTLAGSPFPEQAEPVLDQSLRHIEPSPSMPGPSLDHAPGPGDVGELLPVQSNEARTPVQLRPGTEPAPTLSGSPFPVITDSPEPVDEVAPSDRPEGPVLHHRGTGNGHGNEDEAGPQVREEWSPYFPPAAPWSTADVKPVADDENVHPEDLSVGPDSPETTPTLGSSAAVQTAPVQTGPVQIGPMETVHGPNPGLGYPSDDAPTSIQRDAAEVPHADLASGIAPFLARSEGISSSASLTAAESSTGMVPRTTASRPDQTPSASHPGHSGGTKSASTTSGAGLQRLAVTHSPTPTVSREDQWQGGQSRASVSAGSPYQSPSHDPSLVHLSAPAQRQADHLGTVETEPAAGMADSPEEQIPEGPMPVRLGTASLVGHQLSEMVVARNQWASPSPMGAIDYNPGPVEPALRDDHSRPVPALPSNEDASSPHTTLQPEASPGQTRPAMAPHAPARSGQRGPLPSLSGGPTAQLLVSGASGNPTPPLPIARWPRPLPVQPEAGTGTSFAPLAGSPAAETDGEQELGTAVPVLHRLQRAADGSAEQAPEPAASGGSATAPQAENAGTAAPSAHGGEDIDDLSRRIYDRIRDRLKAELYLDRERAGQLSDLTV